MEPAFVIFIVLLIGLTFRLIAGSFDGQRIDDYVRGRGGTVLSRSWQPFGPGWFGEKNARIYAITYRDREGRTRRAHVKTSMLSGVYLTEDSVIREPRERTSAGATTNSRSDEDLAAENERLRARVRELEQKGGVEGPQA